VHPLRTTALISRRRGTERLQGRRTDHAGRRHRRDRFATVAIAGAPSGGTRALQSALCRAQVAGMLMLALR
jgi:hypothetical protein